MAGRPLAGNRSSLLRRIKANGSLGREKLICSTLDICNAYLIIEELHFFSFFLDIYESFFFFFILHNSLSSMAGGREGVSEGGRKGGRKQRKRFAGNL